MARCRQCNLLVSGAAEHCPRCGIPLRARFHFSARGVVVAGILVVVLFAAVWRGGGPKFDPDHVAALLDKEQSAAAPSSAGSSQAATSQPLVVAIETSVSGGTRPTVTGKTNLPDGTHLLLALRKPWLPNAKERLAAGLPACGDYCGPLTVSGRSIADDVVVKNGRFSDGPFTDRGAALRTGIYNLDVYQVIDPSGQPPEVFAVIGPNGENLRGPLVIGPNMVGGDCFAPPFGMDEGHAKKWMDERRLSPLPWAYVCYSQYVEVGEAPSSPEFKPDQIAEELRKAAATPSAPSTNPLGLSTATTPQCITGPGAPPCPPPWRGDAPAPGPGSSSQYRPNWQKIEADNGAVYDIDLNSIMRYNGMAEAMVYIVEDQYFNPMNMKQLYFDCHGHFREGTTSGLSPPIYATPKSMAAQLAVIACGGE
jgi:hypothetical protein